MQKIFAKKTVSMTDMRDPKKVLEFANGEPVAVMNRNQVVGYFTPSENISNEEDISFVSKEEVSKVSDKVFKKYSGVLEYLKDK